MSHFVVDSDRVIGGRRSTQNAGILAAVLMATVFGCGTPSKPSSSGATSGPGTTSAGASNGVAVVVDAAALGSVADMATAENRLVDAFALTAGLPTDLHPDTWAWANQALHDELAKAGRSIALTGDASLVASLSNSPPMTAVDGGGAVGLAMAAALVVINSGTGSNPTGNLNLSLDSTADTTANGEHTTGVVSGHIVTTTSGSMVAADVEIGVDVTVADASTGAVLRKARFKSRGKITLTFCPDANGKVMGHVTMALDGGTTGAGSASMTVEAEVEGTVGEDAYLQQINATGNTTQSITPAGGGAPRRSVISAGFTSAINHAGNMTGTATSTGQVDSAPDDLTDAEANAAYGQIGTAAGVAYWLLGDYAQVKWRGGMCVEIRASEKTRDVKKNETVQFQAQVFHEIENVELHKPIVNTFVGKASVDPVDIPVPAPVTVSYKAGPKVDDTGTITMTTTSNRGIGTLDLTFRVKGGWIIDASFDRAVASGTINGQKCGDPTGPWIATGTYKPKNVQGVFNGNQKWTITINPDAATGTFEYETTAKGQFAGVPLTIYLVGRASGTVTLSIDPISGVAHMVLRETLHTYYSTTKLGGSGTDQNATLETRPLDWDVGGNC